MTRELNVTRGTVNRHSMPWTSTPANNMTGFKPKGRPAKAANTEGHAKRAPTGDCLRETCRHPLESKLRGVGHFNLGRGPCKDPRCDCRAGVIF